MFEAATTVAVLGSHLGGHHEDMRVKRKNYPGGGIGGVLDPTTVPCIILQPLETSCHQRNLLHRIVQSSDLFLDFNCSWLCANSSHVVPSKTPLSPQYPYSINLTISTLGLLP